MTIELELSNKDNFELLFKYNNQPNNKQKIFVDVGAFDGDTISKTLSINLSINPNLKIIAIEPIKSLWESIRKKYELNKNIIVINKAAYSDKQNLKFHEYVGWSQGLSTIQNSMTQLRPSPQFTNKILEYNIEADTIDNILRDCGIENTKHIDYIKIDTEGSEEQVLQGFTRYCQGTRFHIESHITNLENILQILLEKHANIETITLSRDPNNTNHVVGTIIGEFTQSVQSVNQQQRIEQEEHEMHQQKNQKLEIINVEMAGTNRIQFLIDAVKKYKQKQLSATEVVARLKPTTPADNMQKIINIGCADNYWLRDLTDYDILNVDLENTIPEPYKSKSKFQIADAHNLNFKDKEFNCAILGEILEHVNDPVQVLKEAKRVAQNIFITVPNEHEWHESLKPYKNPAHVRFYTYETLKEDLDKGLGENTYKTVQYNGGGWSFWTISYEPISPIQENNTKQENKQELTITTGPIPESLNIPSHISPKKLRIALISTPFFGVPPQRYGGLEQIVWDLAEALDELGHEITIFAPEGSQIPKHGHLITTGKPINSVNVDWFQAEKNAYDIYKEIINDKDFDICHSHEWFGFPYLLKQKYPDLKVCHTHHGFFNWQSPPNQYPNIITISKFMKNISEQQFKQKGYDVQCKYVYNGIDLNRYEYNPNIKKTDHLLYVGRFSNFKQPHVAIDVAKKVNLPIDLVGGTFVDDPNYLRQIEYMCDNNNNQLSNNNNQLSNNKNIVIYKDVPHEFKIKKMQEAKALLFPSKMGEPYGLVAAETMACGTPVIALNDGAISEVVIHNETGFICNNIEEMIEAVKKINDIKPENCRKRSEELSRENMAKNYETLYYNIINGNEW